MRPLLDWTHCALRKVEVLMLQKEVDYEYRAAWRAGVYEWWSKQVSDGDHSEAVTLTLRNEWAAKATDVLMGKWLDTWLVAERLTGVLVVERGRGDGRVHAHGILTGSSDRLDGAIARWQVTKGFTVRKATTDVMGWCMYMFKATTPETVIIWRRSDGIRESILTPVEGPGRVPATSESEAVLRRVRPERESRRQTVPQRAPWAQG